MQRVIYEVYAKVVDANGAYNTLTGYPKVFDSRHYDNDTAKTLRRAIGEFSDTYGAMCKRDDRNLQMVILLTADGRVVDVKHIGAVPPDPDPEPPQPEPQPEPEPEPEGEEPENNEDEGAGE